MFCSVIVLRFSNYPVKTKGWALSQVRFKPKSRVNFKTYFFHFFMMDWLIFGLVILVTITNSKIQNGENMMDVDT